MYTHWGFFLALVPLSWQQYERIAQGTMTSKNLTCSILENDPEKSWNKLVRVLVEMDKGAIAKKIAEKYCPDFVFPGESAVHVQYLLRNYWYTCNN